MTDTNYNFYVKDASEVDLQRICNEAPPEATAILVTFSHGAILLLRETWLKQFSSEDSVPVVRENLYYNWGKSNPSVVNKEHGIGIDNYYVGAPSQKNTITGWRFAAFAKRDIETTLWQLRLAVRALALIRREVRVSYV